MSADPREEFRAAILAELGADPGPIEPGPLRRFDTGGRLAGWCRLFDDLRAGVFGCYRAGIKRTWHAAEPRPMTAAERASMARHLAQAVAARHAEQRRKWACNAERIGALWAECIPLTRADAVARYLERRGLDACPLPDCLRLHPGLAYWHEARMVGVWPAMVAPLVSPAGELLALHRTYLTNEGHKAPVPTVKKLTGAAGPLAGACIPLALPVRGCIGIAEGIETALAGSQASGVPTVAAYCASNLAAYAWPPGVRRLVVFADPDPAGAAAAQSLKTRAMRAGLSVAVMTPTTPGADWCDVWAQRGTVAAAALEVAA